MSDPFCYPSTNVLINKEAIRDAGELDRFERLATRQRMEEGLPEVPQTVDGYRALHWHIFQDVYSWAGEFRTVNLSKGDSVFCKAVFVQREMNKRFALIQGEGDRRDASVRFFIERIAEHVSELNAIHPFREGNGRTIRAFLTVAGQQAGRQLEIERIDPVAWNAASRESFRTGNTGSMQEVIWSIVSRDDVR